LVFHGPVFTGAPGVRDAAGDPSISLITAAYGNITTTRKITEKEAMCSPFPKNRQRP
jgi:hypothetical protein